MEKIKLFIQSEAGKDILVVFIVILVGLGSFELGRLSKASNSTSGIKITYPEGEQASAYSGLSVANSTKSSVDTKTAPKGFFASSRGSKYYPLGCSAGKTIKQENRVFFATNTEAEAAGYELSSSCK